MHTCTPGASLLSGHYWDGILCRGLVPIDHPEVVLGRIIRIQLVEGIIRPERQGTGVAFPHKREPVEILRIEVRLRQQGKIGNGMCALVIVPVHFSDDLGGPISVEVVEVQLLDLAIVGLDDRVA
jgi:hypothetical protein